MSIDLSLANFAKRALNEARRDLREAKELRNLVKEVCYHGTPDAKRRLVELLTEKRPDLMVKAIVDTSKGVH